jgi:tRNA-dihydrouridine synthase C
MDGITDAPMRATMGELGAFTYAVSEFVRVSIQPVPAHVFARDIPELQNPTSLPVQAQILGGDPDHMATSAQNAIAAGATAIDINFGCPAKVVNRNDGGASLLRCPERIYEITHAVRSAIDPVIPVSVKMRLGWDSIEPIHVNAEQAEKAGAAWITIHARTRTQGYQPPVYWQPIGQVNTNSSIPIVANGDIWTLDDFKTCQEMTGCQHFMIGRPAIARPELPRQIAAHLGLATSLTINTNWPQLLRKFIDHSQRIYDSNDQHLLGRLKQWLAIASRYGDFPNFDHVKNLTNLRAFLDQLQSMSDPN